MCRVGWGERYWRALTKFRIYRGVKFKVALGVGQRIVRHACQSGGGVQHSGLTRPVNIVHRCVGGVHFRAHCSTHNVWSRVKVVKRMRARKLMLLRIPTSNYGREQLH